MHATSNAYRYVAFVSGKYELYLVMPQLSRKLRCLNCSSVLGGTVPETCRLNEVLFQVNCDFQDRTCHDYEITKLPRYSQ